MASDTGGVSGSRAVTLLDIGVPHIIGVLHPSHLPKCVSILGNSFWAKRETLKDFHRKAKATI